MNELGTEIEVYIEELVDGRYIAYASFPMQRQLEDLVTAKDDCRSLHKIFEAVADVYFDSGCLSIGVVQKRREQ